MLQKMLSHAYSELTGRILAPKLGLTGRGQSVLDYGCGSGAAVGFFYRKGFDAYGVDISDIAIKAAQEKFPDIKKNFLCIPQQCGENDRFFDKKFDLIVSIQVLYYLNDSDLQRRLVSIKNMLKPGGIFYATMMGVKHTFFENAEYYEDGLFHVHLDNERYPAREYYINFITSRRDLINKFSLFNQLYIGWYDEVYDESESASRFHWTFMGR